MIHQRPKDVGKESNISTFRQGSWNFLVKIATCYEKEKIMKIMISEHRQTMNLRLMPTAQLLLLQDKNNNKVIGWMGFDYQYNPQFPETFSLYLMPNYRGNHLSLILKHAVYSIFVSLGITKSFLRMEASHNQNLILYNVRSGFYRILSPLQINPAWQAMCLKCELYRKNCKSQVYLEADISKLIASLNNKFGKLSDVYFPKSFTLQSNFISKSNGINSNFPMWNYHNV